MTQKTIDEKYTKPHPFIHKISTIAPYLFSFFFISHTHKTTFSHFPLFRYYLSILILSSASLTPFPLR